MKPSYTESDHCAIRVSILYLEPQHLGLVHIFLKKKSGAAEIRMYLRIKHLGQLCNENIYTNSND